MKIEYNNFDYLLDHQVINFNDKTKGYFIQIMKRRKDNPDAKRSEKLIQSYFINSLEKYKKIQPEIISLCIEHNARAYIRINRRDILSSHLKLISYLTDMMSNGNITVQTSICHSDVMNNYYKVLGRFKTDKLYMVDFDKDDGYNSFEVAEYLGKLLFESKKKGIISIPTPNGYHFISEGFHVKKFNDRFPKLYVHTDATTLLYMIKELM